MFIVMRHAERGDLSIPQYLSPIQFDPPLSKQGIDSISQISAEYQKMFRRYNIKSIKIITSPFLRCIMTAQLIYFNIKQLNENLILSAIEIEPKASQYLRSQWFSQFPLNNLVIDSPQNKTKYLKLQYSNPSHKQKFNFPENYGNLSKRTREIKNSIDNLMKENSRCCYVLVTHGFLVRQLCSDILSSRNYFDDEISYGSYQAEIQVDGKKKIIKYLKDKKFMCEKL